MDELELFLTKDLAFLTLEYLPVIEQFIIQEKEGVMEKIIYFNERIDDRWLQRNIFYLSVNDFVYVLDNAFYKVNKRIIKKYMNIHKNISRAESEFLIEKYIVYGNRIPNYFENCILLKELVED